MRSCCMIAIDDCHAGTYFTMPFANRNICVNLICYVDVSCDCWRTGGTLEQKEALTQR